MYLKLKEVINLHKRRTFGLLLFLTFGMLDVEMIDRQDYCMWRVKRSLVTRDLALEC